jgi:hypothetical protein
VPLHGHPSNVPLVKRPWCDSEQVYGQTSPGITPDRAMPHLPPDQRQNHTHRKITMTYLGRKRERGQTSRSRHQYQGHCCLSSLTQLAHRWHPRCDSITGGGNTPATQQGPRGGLNRSLPYLLQWHTHGRIPRPASPREASCPQEEFHLRHSR